MRRREEGFTLVELMVVVAVFGVVVALASRFLIGMADAAGSAEAGAQAESRLELALRTVGSDVRAAAPISSTCPLGGSEPAAFATCLQFTVAHDPNPTDLCPRSVITYWLATTTAGGRSVGTVYEDSTDYTGSPSDCTTRTGYSQRPVVTGLDNGTTPLFTYFDAYGNQLATSGASPSPVAAFPAAATIMISLVDAPGGGAADLHLTTTVALRNSR